MLNIRKKTVLYIFSWFLCAEMSYYLQTLSNFQSENVSTVNINVYYVCTFLYEPSLDWILWICELDVLCQMFTNSFLNLMLSTSFHFNSNENVTLCYFFAALPVELPVCLNLAWDWKLGFYLQNDTGVEFNSEAWLASPRGIQIKKHIFSLVLLLSLLHSLEYLSPALKMKTVEQCDVIHMRNVFFQS